MIGNVPFADVKLDYRGQKLLPARLLLRQVHRRPEARRRAGPGHQRTSRSTSRTPPSASISPTEADFLGAIRLPSDAFKREGTAVVTDIVFLRKRAPGRAGATMSIPTGCGIAPLAIEGVEIPDQPLLPEPSRDGARQLEPQGHALCGEGYSVIGNGDLAEQLQARHPAPARMRSAAAHRPSETSRPPTFTPPPPERHIAEGSFFIGDDQRHLPIDRRASRARRLRRHDAESRRHHDRQAPGRPDRPARPRPPRPAVAERGLARGAPRRRPAANSTGPTTASSSAYGPINKTTFSETADGNVIRRMPNLVKFREDPDAMLVMSLEDYDEVTGKAAKAAIMKKDVVGRSPPVTSVRSAEEGLLVSLEPARRGRSALHRHALRQARGARSSPSWAT